MDKSCTWRDAVPQVRPITNVIALLAALSLAGCASTPAPREQLAFANAAVSDASRAGGAEYASPEMRSAQDKLDRANQAMARNDYDHARVLAEEAEVDAKLAGARARSVKAQRAAAEVQDSIRAMREEIGRSTK